jgi:heme o synthase
VIPAVGRTLVALAALVRVNLSLAVAVSAVAGFVCVSHTLSWKALSAFAGVGLLAAAASALNQIQEKDLDGRMERTRNRPLPLGIISIRQALAAASILGIAGWALLFFGTTPLASLLGVCASAWYNLAYTPLKRKTLFAVPVGALTGALAPVIGCVAATGRIRIPAVGIAFFIFFWQIPHFLLMLLTYGQEYEKAGFPYVSILKDGGRFRNIALVWYAAASASTLLFPLFGSVSNIALIAALVLQNAAFVLYFYFRVVRANVAVDFVKAFRSMYLFQGCMLATVIVQGFFPYS